MKAGDIGKALIHARTEILGEQDYHCPLCMGKSFGLMDYWSHEGYLALKRALSMMEMKYRGS
jgi:hypothetical protein